jgi:glycosyltransferase involved in cell wall biosynthesis
MKVLILHNFYQNPGGEDTVVAAESALLREAGHEVHVETVSNHAIQTISDRVQAFLRAPYDAARERWIQALIVRHRPDVVHIHNFFPLLTPAVHMAAAKAGAAVVQTLHNFRVICANGFLLRDGAICEKCIHGGPYWALVHRCYRKSMPGSLALVRMQLKAGRDETWQRYVHRFIVLTEFARAKFVDAGLPANKITIKPNFVSQEPVLNEKERKGALFVGRLSKEKGVHNLVEAWKNLKGIPLTIVGEGPAREQLEAEAPAHVSFVGWRNQAEVRELMAGAQALLIPSLWYEGLPMTLLEAYSTGLPVIASRIGALVELVDAGTTGLHFAPTDVEDLSSVVRTAFSDPKKLKAMGDAARKVFELKYTPETNLPCLEAIYAAAIEESRKAYKIQTNT